MDVSGPDLSSGHHVYNGFAPYLRELILAHPLFKPKDDCLNNAAFA